MTTQEKRIDSSMKECLSNWEESIRAAILSYENSQRKSMNEPLLDSHVRVMFQSDQRSLMRLMNWRVWSIRYCIPLDFIVTALLDRYRLQRKRSIDPDIVLLGMPVAMKTGARARQIIEDEVSKTYPDRENYRAMRQKTVPVPITKLEYETPEQFVDRYTKAIEEKRKEWQRTVGEKRRYRKV